MMDALIQQERFFPHGERRSSQTEKDYDETDFPSYGWGWSNAKIAAEQVPWDSSLATCNVYSHRKGTDLNRKTAGLIVLPETSVIFEVVAYFHYVMCLFPKKVLFSFQLILIDWSVILELKSFCYLSMVLMSMLI